MFKLPADVLGGLKICDRSTRVQSALPCSTGACHVQHGHSLPLTPEKHPGRSPSSVAKVTLTGPHLPFRHLKYFLDGGPRGPAEGGCSFARSPTRAGSGDKRTEARRPSNNEPVR